jgi:hypothetical protein
MSLDIFLKSNSENTLIHQYLEILTGRTIQLTPSLDWNEINMLLNPGNSAMTFTLSLPKIKTLRLLLGVYEELLRDAYLIFREPNAPKWFRLGKDSELMILDSNTGLLWQDLKLTGQVEKLETALKQVATMTWAGQQKWRLPTCDELAGFAGVTELPPIIIRKGFDTWLHQQGSVKFDPGNLTSIDNLTTTDESGFVIAVCDSLCHNEGKVDRDWVKNWSEYSFNLGLLTLIGTKMTYRSWLSIL